MPIAGFRQLAHLILEYRGCTQSTLRKENHVLTAQIRRSRPRLPHALTMALAILSLAAVTALLTAPSAMAKGRPCNQLNMQPEEHCFNSKPNGPGMSCPRGRKAGSIAFPDLNWQGPACHRANRDFVYFIFGPTECDVWKKNVGEKGAIRYWETHVFCHVPQPGQVPLRRH